MKELWGKTKDVVLKAPDGSDVPVTVKTVGTPEHPLLWDEIEKRREQAFNVLVLKAPKQVEEVFGSQNAAIEALCLNGDARRKAMEQRGMTYAEPQFLEAVHIYVTGSAEYVPALSRQVRDRVVHGIVGGEQKYHELFRIGGTELLRSAAQAVEEFNKPDPKN